MEAEVKISQGEEPQLPKWFYPTEEYFPDTLGICRAFALFFAPIYNRCPEESIFFYDLPNGARFSMGVNGDDVECDLTGLTDQDLIDHAHLFRVIDQYLKEKNLVSGETIAELGLGVLADAIGKGDAKW